VAVIKTRISKGEFTERGIARTSGLSQPQVHNVLKGARGLTPETADLLMEALNIAFLDLLSHGEVLRKIAMPPVGLPVFAPRKPSGSSRRISEEYTSKAG
jgi:transcriptional regulator with XRE-family HTH domain